MGSERIKVVWDSSPTAVINALNSFGQKLEDVGRKSDAVGKTSDKAARAAVGSYNALHKELRKNEQALKNMKQGTQQFEQQRAKVEQLRDSLEGAKQNLHAHNEESGQMLGIADSAIGKIAGLAGGLASVGTLVSVIMEQTQKARQITENALNTKLDFQEVFARQAANFQGEKLADVQKKIVAASPDIGISPNQLVELVGTANSAGSGGTDNSLKLIAEAAKASGTDEETTRHLASIALDMKKVFGVQNTAGAMGLVSSVGAVSRVTDFADLAGKLGAVFTKATNETGKMNALTAEQTGELFALTTQMTNIPQASENVTAMSNFLGKLQSFTPETSKKLRDGSEANVSKELVRKFEGTRDFEDKIELFRSNKELAKQFAETLGADKTASAMADIVFGTKTALQQERLIKAAVKAPEESGKALRDRQQQIAEQMPELMLQKRIQAQIDSRRIERDASGAQADKVAGEIMDDNLTGLDSLIQWAAGTPVEMAARAIGGEQKARDISVERLRMAQGGAPIPGLNILQSLGIVGSPDKEAKEQLNRGQRILEDERARQQAEAAIAQKDAAKAQKEAAEEMKRAAVELQQPVRVEVEQRDDPRPRPQPTPP